MNTVVADNYLCFMALLEMIVSDSYSAHHYSQTDFAELFGITIPFDTHTTIRNVQYSKSITDCGTNICIGEINDFFLDKLIPLHLSFIPSSYFDETTVGDIIDEKKKNSYIVFAFSYGFLYDEPQNKDVGHVVLFENIDSKADTLGIYDPGPRNHGSKTVKVDDMVYAMKRRGGIYLFEKDYR